MTNINLYANGGSKNHGCEAILRATNKILGKRLCVYSTSPQEDIENEIDKIMEIKEVKDQDIKKGSLKYYILAIYIKLFKFNVKIKKRCRIKKFPHLFH